VLNLIALLWEELRLRVFYNRVLRAVLGLKRDEGSD
jgi:hypothetical protein